MKTQEAKKILDKLSNKKIMVIGDLILDQYILGDVNRISPEAPVQVVKVDKEKFGLGGAANVSNNIKSLGATPIVVGSVANDPAGKQMKSLFKKNGINTDGIFTTKNKPTIQKKRIISRNQQLIRIDYEDTENTNNHLQQKFLKFIKNKINELDVIIFQDYNKGLITEELIESTIKLANKHKVLTGVDPKKKNFFSFRNVTLFKPNRAETEDNMNTKISSEKELIPIAKEMIKKLSCQHLLITLGADGMFIYSKDGSSSSIPTFTQEVYDVTGAGDTVISTLMLALASGCSIKNAAIIANHAAGVVCGKVGAKPATKEEILESFHNWHKGNR